ncbi:hypothetical protein IC582_012135 [Cucumis melo]
MPCETRACRPLFSEAPPYARKEPLQRPGVQRAKTIGIRSDVDRMKPDDDEANLCFYSELRLPRILSLHIISVQGRCMKIVFNINQ